MSRLGGQQGIREVPVPAHLSVADSIRISQSVVAQLVPSGVAREARVRDITHR
jgi:hypothetical protein